MAVRASAPAWMRAAMDLALRSLQRREDLSVMRWPDATGVLRVQQLKTQARVEIEPWPELTSAITACRDSVHCPFIIHRLPGKARPQQMRAEDRQHFAQVLPEQLSREFAEARDTSKFYAGNATPPTFHEIRSLGADLYRKAGWPEGMIQALLGHANVQQTRAYLDGHDAPWVRVSGAQKIG